MDDYRYHAFISYKSEDLVWASSLRNKLLDRNLSVYQDVELRGGENWLPQLQTALEQSRHLVVVWSKRAAAKALGWVQKEMYHFEYQCRQKTTDKQSRRIVIVHVDNERSPDGFADLHARRDLQAWGEKGDQPSVVPDAVWKSLTAKLYADLTYSPEHVEVPTIVLASRRDYFRSINLNAPLSSFGRPLTTVLSDLGLSAPGAATDVESLCGRYGETREEWRPFGPAEATVDDLLASVQADVNDSLKRGGLMPIKLSAVDSSFWGNDVMAVERATRGLAAKPVLIVIDPLSLSDDQIRDRVARLRTCLHSSFAAVVMLGPLGLGHHAEALSRHVHEVATNIYEHFYDPALPLATDMSIAATDLGDGSQIKRCLLLALGNSNRSRTQASPVPFLDHGL